MSTSAKNQGQAPRAVGYCRTSSEGQRDNTSIPIQKKAIEQFCQRNGWKFVDHYVDESKTGAKIAGRDDFQKMLKDAALEKFDVIVPFDVSRFARDGVDILDNAKFLRINFGVHVVDTKGGFDSRPGGNVLLNFVHAGVSEYERLKIMERMIGGRIHNVHQGLPWSGKQPFGRTFDRATGKWNINERGRRMKQMLERYVNGEGFATLLKEFTEFSSSRVVLTFINHSQLSGTYVKEFNIPELNITGLKIPVPQIPEIISPKLFARVQARMEHRRTWNFEHRRKYILTGFLKCGHCGVAMTGNCTAGRIYYRHCNYKPGKHCAFHSIKGEELEDPVLDYLFSFFTDEPTFMAAVARAMPNNDERKELVAERDRVKAMLVKSQNQLARLVDAIAEGVSPALLVKKQTDIKTDLDRNSDRLGSIEARLEEMPDAEVLGHQATAIRLQLLAKVKNRDWRKLPVDEVHRFLIFLFGENPRKSGNGISVRREQGRWSISFKGKVEFFHDIEDGRPLLTGAKKYADRVNARAKRELDKRVVATRQT